MDWALPWLSASEARSVHPWHACSGAGLDEMLLLGGTLRTLRRLSEKTTSRSVFPETWRTSALELVLSASSGGSAG